MSDTKDTPEDHIDHAVHAPDAAKALASHAEHRELGYEATAEDLPHAYYRSVYFCGTMVACGASFGSVSHSS